MEYLTSLASFRPSGDNVFLYSSIGLCVLSIVVYEVLRRYRGGGTLADGRLTDNKSSVKSAAYRNGNPPREYGHWVPLDFRRPAARPFSGWSLANTKPLPYRPFKWGAYHVTMGIRSMPWDEWIELDNRFDEFQRIRAARLAERGARVCRTAPEALPAALELLEQLAAYLPQRYPTLYRLTEKKLLENVVTGETFDVNARPIAEDPMAMASRLVQDDLAIMIEREDGQYYLLAGAILVAGFWRLEDKFGKSIREIHGSGRGVPEFRTKLQKGMENFFRRVTPDKPVVRFNYAIQADGDLAWSRSLGDEDCPDEGDFGWFAAEKNRAIEHHYFRSERQTLLRLPRTGGVVFTIRTYFEKVTDICQEPGVAGRLASAIRGWGEDVSRYKGKEWYVDVVLEYLDRKHAEQKAEGLVEDTEEHDLFPF